MKIYKCFIDMDDYFPKETIDFDFDKYKSLKIDLKFDEDFEGYLLYELKSYGLIKLSSVIRNIENGLEIKEDIYSGFNVPNIFEQFYSIKSSEYIFLIKVSRNFQYRLNIETLNYIYDKNLEKDGTSFLKNFFLWSDLTSEFDTSLLAHLLQFLKVECRFLLIPNIDEFLDIINLLIDRLLYEGIIIDYIDENTKIRNYENLLTNNSNNIIMDIVYYTAFIFKNGNHHLRIRNLKDGE